MIATTFSSDAPYWATEQVRRYSVAGNWKWWAFVLTGLGTVLLLPDLWRRSGVATDLEFYELHYSGKSASMVRGFRAGHLGLFFNCFIMGALIALCMSNAQQAFQVLPRLFQTLSSGRRTASERRDTPQDHAPAVGGQHRERSSGRRELTWLVSRGAFVLRHNHSTMLAIL